MHHPHSANDTTSADVLWVVGSVFLVSMWRACLKFYRSSPMATGCAVRVRGEGFHAGYALYNQ